MNKILKNQAQESFISFLIKGILPLKEANLINSVGSVLVYCSTGKLAPFPLLKNKISEILILPMDFLSDSEILTKATSLTIKILTNTGIGLILWLPIIFLIFIGKKALKKYIKSTIYNLKKLFYEKF